MVFGMKVKAIIKLLISERFADSSILNITAVS